MDRRIRIKRLAASYILMLILNAAGLDTELDSGRQDRLIIHNL